MKSRLPMIFIVCTVVLDAMGIGLIMPVMPELLKEVRNLDLADAAIWGGVLTTAFAVMQFLFGPIVGNLSDRFGRRPVLLVSLSVMTVDYLVLAVAGSIWLLLVARIIGGITAATHATAAAYIADISAPEDKAKNFGLIGAGFGIGFVLGPILGGMLGEFGTRAPFYAAAAITATNGILGFLVLKETVTDKIRRPFSWKRANPFGAFRAVTKLPGLGALLLVFFFYQIASHVYPVIWSYFTAERFAWSPRMIGFSLGIFGISFAIVQGALVQPAIRYFGNRGTVVLGISMEIGMLIFMGLVTSGLLTLIMTPAAALASIGLPALQGILSRRVPDDAQGELQGVLSSVTSVAMIISPIAMTQTFAYFSAPNAPIYAPGSAFLLAAVLMTASLVTFLAIKRQKNTPEMQNAPGNATRKSTDPML